MLDQVRYATHAARNSMTCHPSVTGMPPLRCGMPPQRASIVTMIDGACNLWYLLAQNIESRCFMAHQPLSPGLQESRRDCACAHAAPCSCLTCFTLRAQISHIESGERSHELQAQTTRYMRCAEALEAHWHSLCSSAEVQSGGDASCTACGTGLDPIYRLQTCASECCGGSASLPWPCAERGGRMPSRTFHTPGQ